MTSPDNVQRGGWKPVAFLLLPPLVSLILYWPGLTAWFQRDDFAWLGLWDAVHNGRDLLWALFAPLAQGTIRTISERLMFLCFTAAFGLNPLPYRILAFLTHCANLVLAGAVAQRLTGSRAAGFWAAMLWTVNGTMAAVLAWTAIYYELLCSSCFLLGLWFLIRYAETGKGRFLAAQWITFLLGFGVLEINVVYPALALTYAFCRARHLVSKILPMFAVSAAYSVLHFSVAPLSSSGPYKMYWDVGMLKTLTIYTLQALGPAQLALLGVTHGRTVLAAPLILGLTGFVIWKLRNREWIVLLFPAWFVIVLAPLLPLKEHVSDYYLTVPLIGPCMLAGWAVSSAWNAKLPGKAVAAALLLLYLGVSIPVAWAGVRQYHEASIRIKTRILRIVTLQRTHPEKAILLQGVDTEMFRAALAHRPFRLFGYTEVYLLPGPDLAEEARDFSMSAADARKLLAGGHAELYDVSGAEPREVTPSPEPVSPESAPAAAR